MRRGRSSRRLLRRRSPRRLGSCSALEELLLFLAGPENTYITGQTVIVDGGLSITF